MPVVLYIQQYRYGSGGDGVYEAGRGSKRGTSVHRYPAHPVRGGTDFTPCSPFFLERPRTKTLVVQALQRTYKLFSTA